MSLFGQTHNFAIEYEFEVNPFGEKGLNGASWGRFSFWAEGADICKLNRGSQLETYRWNLLGIFEWLCENLTHILEVEQFPVPAVGSSTVELIADSYNRQPRGDDELDDWADKKEDWEFRHSWYSARAGSFLARVYFRRVDNQIEVSWDNSSTYADNNISFDFPKGICLIDVKEFREVVCDFLNDFAEKLSERVPGDTDLDSRLFGILPSGCR